MKIAVLVSGGVDSSVALNLLKDQGHELVAFYLKIWLEDELAYLGNCPWQEDLAYVQAVCKELGVPLEIISLQEEYWNNVVSYTISSVKAGLTPSPDLLCNKLIKFGAFFEKIDDSFDKIASGHYAQIEEKDGLFLLKKARDLFKDQTYFLSRLSQKQLSRILFPIGDLTKTEVRQLAHDFNLQTKTRKDSQGICFLGKIKFSEFIKHHLGIQKGDLINIDAREKIGQHDGFWYYTVGQRKGIGLSGGPWYVVAKDPVKNIVYISRCYHAPDKKRDMFDVSQFNWVNGNVIVKQDLQVKVRHGEDFYQGRLDFIDGNQEKSRGRVVLDKNDQGIASGQFAVFYDGDICLGSGVMHDIIVCKMVAGNG